jgi:cell wall-associated NlpC family hydrolase
MCPLPSLCSEPRQIVASEARTWLGTTWHHEARVKGAGVDCAQFLIAVYVATGLIADFAPEHYPIDWHLHRDEPRFIAYLLEHADPVDVPLPGDIAMFQFGRQSAHGAIVLDWPLIIHAYRDEGAVVMTDCATSPLLARLSGFYRLKGLA